MIFIDTNVPMYFVGADGQLKAATVRLLERAVSGRQRLVTDAEVFQEILHRYVAINRHEAIEPAFAVLNELVDEIFSIDATVVRRAKSLVLGYRTLSARDAVHIASMQEHGVTHVMSFDSGFDIMPGLVRLSV